MSIGTNILKKQSGEKMRYVAIEARPRFVAEVLNVLSESEPLNVTQIQKRARIKSWNTARKIVELLVKHELVVIHHVDKTRRVTTYYTLRR